MCEQANAVECSFEIEHLCAEAEDLEDLCAQANAEGCFTARDDFVIARTRQQEAADARGAHSFNGTATLTIASLQDELGQWETGSMVLIVVGVFLLFSVACCFALSWHGQKAARRGVKLNTHVARSTSERL